MIEADSQRHLRNEIAARMAEDRELLDALRGEIRPLRSSVRRIQERTATAISLVGTDGGNNRLQFDPFLVQLVRVVDSSNNEYALEAITPSTKVDVLSAKQFDDQGQPTTPLGEMMHFLGVTHLTQLSHMIRSRDGDTPTSPTWVQVYRELVEWATLFSLVRGRPFGTDTVVIYDGLLRSKAFAQDLFAKYLVGIREGIQRQFAHNRRRLYLAGVAKHSKVLTRYRLAMALEGILTSDYPAYLEIPRELERKAYVWPEYARDDDESGGEANKFVGGKMFFVKFGNRSRDPVWPIDIFLDQVDTAPVVLGYMLADAMNGFPVPFYPLSLQKAHENAALVDFDLDILQDDIFDGIREALSNEAPVLDAFRLQTVDVAQARYD